MATILIVDDHPTNRALLVTLLGYQQHCLLEAADGVEALALVRSQRPHLVITDLLMPEMDGFELVQQLRIDASTAQTRVVFYSANYSGNETTALAHACGVQYLLSKPSEPELILHTVKVALHEAVTPITVSPENFTREHRRLLTNTLLQRVEMQERGAWHKELSDHTEVASLPLEGGVMVSPKQLTPRQREILKLIAEGRSTQEMARKLFVSVKTIETHRAHLMNRVNIHNVAGLVRYAMRQGMLPMNC